MLTVHAADPSTSRHYICDCFYRAELKTEQVMLSPYDTIGEALLLMHSRCVRTRVGVSVV